MQFDLQKYQNNSDVNCVPLSDTSVSDRPCWLNSCLRILIIFYQKNLWPFGIDIHNYQKSVHLWNQQSPHELWMLWVCYMCIHNSWWIFLCFDARDTTLDCLFMSESMLAQDTTLPAMAFIQLMSGCSECNCLRTALLSFVGITTQSANKTLISDGQRVPLLLKLLQLSSEVRWPWASEKLDNILKYLVLLLPLLHFKSHHRNFSDIIGKSVLEVILNADDYYDSVVIWGRIIHQPDQILLLSSILSQNQNQCSLLYLAVVAYCRCQESCCMHDCLFQFIWKNVRSLQQLPDLRHLLLLLFSELGQNVVSSKSELISPLIFSRFLTI